MKKINKMKFILLSILSVFFLVPVSSNAAGEHEIVLTAVVCDSELYNSTNAATNYTNCRKDYVAGNLSSYVKDEDGDEVEAGDILMVVLSYKKGSVAEISGITTITTYDSTTLTPLMINSTTFAGLNNNSAFPQDDFGSSTWTTQFTADTDAEEIVTIVREVNGSGAVLDSDVDLGYMFFSVNEIDAGTEIPLGLNTSNGQAVASNPAGNTITYNATGITLKIPGETLSRDTTLGTLTVKNGDTVYPLSSELVPGSSEKTVFDVVVPNDIEYVDISATPYNSGASVLPGGIGKKTLDTIGNNSFKLIVTSAAGNTQDYIINVYRLSADATLSSITFTNSISVGDMIDDQYSYSTTIPYAIKETTVSATPTHTNAFVDSGEGSWDLPNSGDSANNRTIVVKAENCLEKYEDVPGNTCSSKNYHITINREAASTNNYLKSLSAGGVAVAGFNKTVNEYDIGNVSADTESILINGTVEDTGKATVEGIGTITLNVGENIIPVTVIAENGSKNTYTVKVYKLSNEYNLSNITITNDVTDSTAVLKPEFQEDFYTGYSYEYEATVTEITVTATVKDTDKARVVIYDASLTDTSTLVSTLNTSTAKFGLDTEKVIILVTAEDASTKSYTIDLSRKQSSDSTLRELTITPGTILDSEGNPLETFDPSTREYDAVVEPNITNVTVNAIPNSIYGKIKSISGNTDLQFGSDNRIEIVVEAEDGSTSPYYLKVTRKKYDIATLDMIKINDEDLAGFNSEVLTYTLNSVPFETTEIKVEGIKSNQYASKTGDGTIELKTGKNEIIITVVSQDESQTKQYVLTIERAKNYDNTISNLTVKGVEAENTDTGIYTVTLPNDVTVINPEDVVFDVSSDTSVNKTMVLSLTTEDINIYEFTVTSESGLIQKYQIKITRTKSNDSSIGRVTLTIGDDSSRYCLMEDETNTCKISVPVDTTSFSLFSTIHSEATIDPENDTVFDMPANESTKEIELTVTAEDETSSKYTVIVERQKSSNANLSEIKVNGTSVGTITAEESNYYVTVPGLTSTALIEATVEDTGKAIIETDLSEAFDLEFGSNEIKIKVIAEDTTAKTYSVFITREKGIDVTLSNLTINGIQISDFASDKTEYDLEDVPYSTHSLNIVATPNDTLASKTGDGLIELKTKENIITITVTAHNGIKKQNYIINVNRAQNSDTGIQSITLAGKTAQFVEFDGSIDVYKVTVPYDVDEANTENLKVVVNNPVTDYDKLAEATFIDTPLLTTKENEILITVTAEDGSTEQYKLIVERQKADDATLSSLTVEAKDKDGNITYGSFSPSFKPNGDSYDNAYTVTVGVDTVEFTVRGILTDSNAKITSGVDSPITMDTSTKKVDVTVVSEDANSNRTYKLTVNRTLSSINTLKDITIDGVSLEDFDPGTTSYEYTVAGNVTKVDIGATLTDSRGEIISGLGNLDLNVGENPVTIVVKSESGATNNYTIKIIREKKFDNNLLSLTVDGVSVPDFSPEKIEYVITDSVPYSKSSVVIAGELSDKEDATVTGLGPQTLKTGTNILKVVVTAQNDTPKTYTITINRDKNNNAYLSTLSVKGYAFNFNKETESYNITVAETKDTLSKDEITAIAEDTNANIEMPEEINLLTTGINTFSIKVTAEDGETTKTYTLNITRPKSTDIKLKEVQITGANIEPTFSPDKTVYTITVPYGGDKFTITGIPNVDTTTVTGNGEYSIKDGKVELITNPEDESAPTGKYTFNIVEAPSNDATLTGLSVTGYKITPEFKSTTTSYDIGNITIGTERIEVITSTNNVNAKVEYYIDNVKQTSNIIDIPQTLGEKTITVKVIAADGVTPKDYFITYTVVKSNNAYLSDIEPSKGTLEFQKTVEDYKIELPNTETSIELDLTTEDANATIEVGDDSAFHTMKVSLTDLKEGKTTVNIKVIAQDLTEKYYSVEINRLAPELSSDAFLSDLSVFDNTLEYPLDNTFEPEVYEYSIGEIPFALDKLTINAKANVGSSKISYLVNGIPQSSKEVSIPKVEGPGAITIKVVAEDGVAFNNYKITYTKTASTNAKLSNIVVSEGSLEFNENTFKYIVEVGNDVNTIDVTATKADPTASMAMNGTIFTSPHTLTLTNLKEGDTEVVIVVTAENGKALTYSVIVRKEADILTTITSVKYGHSILNGNIKTVKINTTGIEMKNQLDNENEYLEIWTADETRKVSDSEVLATGMIVKLIIDGVERDRKFIVIKGDTTGDGEIDLFDAMRILNDYLNRTKLSGPYLEAGYTNADTDLDLFDAMGILNHYLERTFLH